ncbi:MAG: YicC family protein [Holophagales bacterium]|nr:YicC family protein [Holophagales bacterium]
MKSMTGFGRAASELGGVKVSATVQTVNHRNLDLVIRLPETLREAEPEIRELLASRLTRGRCETQVVVSENDASRRARLDPAAVRAWLEAARPLVDAGLVEPRITLGDLVRAGGTVLGSTEPDGVGESAAALVSLVGEALDQTVRAREFEGERLATVLGERMDELESWVEALEGRRADAVARASSALRARVAELAGSTTVSEERLAQEVAILADRADVREELDRLRAHVEQFREISAGAGPLGRRLDFLVQEMLRELNTLGAKCRDVEMTRHALEAKVVCEQMREQIQNVE